MQNLGGLGVTQGHRKHRHLHDRGHMTYYSTLIETTCTRLSCTIFEL